METYYVANRKLIITNAAGSVPSVVKVDTDEVFSLDGTEIVDVVNLLQLLAIRPYEGTTPPLTIEPVVTDTLTQDTPRKRRPAIRSN